MANKKNGIKKRTNAPMNVQDSRKCGKWFVQSISEPLQTAQIGFIE